MCCSELWRCLVWKPHAWLEFAGCLCWKPHFWGPKNCDFAVFDECLCWNRRFSNTEGCRNEFPHFFLLILRWEYEYFCWFWTFYHRNFNISWNDGSKTDLPSIDNLVLLYFSPSSSFSFFFFVFFFFFFFLFLSSHRALSSSFNASLSITSLVYWIGPAECAERLN